MRALYLAAGLLAAGCGNDQDQDDFEDLQGVVGAVPGIFNLRLAPPYRAKLDFVLDEINDLVPGHRARLIGRMNRTEVDGEGWDPRGVQWDDLLRVRMPAAVSESINRRLFKALVGLGGNRPVFEIVDPDKYLQGPMGEPVPVFEPTFDARFVQDDPRAKDQYYLEMIRWRDAVASYDPARLAAKAPVVVAVLDTGLDATHEDLQGVVWASTNPETAGAIGFDSGANAPILPLGSRDGNGHGTHVAGLIAANGGNALGIQGIAAGLAEVMPIRVLNDFGAGTSAEIDLGLKWAVTEHRRQKKAVPERANQKMVVNLSLGGPFDAGGYKCKTDATGACVFEDDLLNYVTADGDVLLVVAAGNESCGIGGACDVYGERFDEAWYYPCSYANVLCVAATTHEDVVAGFSNRRASVALMAPGWEIVSTVPANVSPSGYANYSGTSQATPIVSAAAAAVWALYPEFTAKELKEILVKSSTRLDSLALETLAKSGRLDLYAAVQYAKSLVETDAKPAQKEPLPGMIGTARIIAGTPPVSAADPMAASKHAVKMDPKDLGEGSGKGCAVVGGLRDGDARVACLLLLAALVIPFLRRDFLADVKES